jgi:hypothetical protein
MKGRFNVLFLLGQNGRSGVSREAVGNDAAPLPRPFQPACVNLRNFARPHFGGRVAARPLSPDPRPALVILCLLLKRGIAIR